MGKKVINIDKFLEEKSFDVVIKGKTYTIRDIPADMDDLAKQGVDGLRKGVAKMLGCELKDIEDLGQGALFHILEEAQKAFLPSLGSPQKTSEG